MYIRLVYIKSHKILLMIRSEQTFVFFAPPSCSLYHACPPPQPTKSIGCYVIVFEVNRVLLFLCATNLEWSNTQAPEIELRRSFAMAESRQREKGGELEGAAASARRGHTSGKSKIGQSTLLVACHPLAPLVALFRCSATE